MKPERRKSPRITLQGDYYWRPDKPEKKLEYVLRNVSITGACIWTGENLKNDEIILLHFGGAREIVLKSRVVWGSKNNYGLLFFLETSREFEDISFIMNNPVSRSADVYS